MITVSIVTYKTPAAELTDILQILDCGNVKKIYVIDNASERRIRDICASFPKTEYIPSANRGYGAGHNIALRRVLDEEELRYHLVLNTDIRFDNSAIGEMESYMDGHADIGLLHPLVLNPDGSMQHTARLVPAPADLIIRRFCPSGWFKKSRDRYLMKSADKTRPFEAGYVQGSFMFFRIEALRQAGLFDERFFMYPEDIDISRRIHGKWKVVCLPEVRVVHDHRGASYKSMKMLRIHMSNMIRYFNKWGWLADKERERINARII